MLPKGCKVSHTNYGPWTKPAMLLVSSLVSIAVAVGFSSGLILEKLGLLEAGDLIAAYIVLTIGYFIIFGSGGGDHGSHDPPAGPQAERVLAAAGRAPGESVRARTNDQAPPALETTLRQLLRDIGLKSIVSIIALAMPCAIIIMLVTRPTGQDHLGVIAFASLVISLVTAYFFRHRIGHWTMILVWVATVSAWPPAIIGYFF